MSADYNILDAQSNGGSLQYAGFINRFAAAIIDGIICSIPSYALQYALMSSATGLIVAQILGVLLQMFYFAYFESGEKQATFGKQAMGIKVVSMTGERISFANAIGRFFAKIPSALILFIGYIMAAFTEKKQALHDIMAGTLVVKS